MRASWAAIVLLGCTITTADALGALYSQPYNSSQFVLGSNSGLDQQVAEDFQLPAPFTVTHVEWWGGLTGTLEVDPLPTRQFIVRFFADVGGSPASSFLSSQTVNATATDTGVDCTRPGSVFGYSIFNYSANIAPVNLNAGTTYWLSVLNDSNTFSSQWVWQAGSFIPGESVSHRSGDSGAWTPITEVSRNTLSYELPEPGGLILLPIGLLALAKRNRHV